MDPLHSGLSKLMLITSCWLRRKPLKKVIYLLWKSEKQVVEGAGATAIAPIMENGDMFKGETVVAVISGGNIEEKQLRNILGS